MNYAIVVAILALVTLAAVMKKTPVDVDDVEPTQEPEYESFSQPISVDGKYELIFPRNNTFITSPISGLSPDYTLDEFKTIFSRFIHMIEQYNSFSETRRRREDEEMEDLPPINILDIQFDIVLARCDHMSVFNNNRLIATMNFISAQLGLTEKIAKDSDMKKLIERLKKGFRYDPMAAVPIHSE